MINLYSALWAGAVRTVLCPHCCLSQTVARRPMPFELTCRQCQRRLVVTERGAETKRRG